MIPFPNKKYQIIYADPPWEYEASRNIAPKSCLSGDDKGHYSYMSIEDLHKLNIQSIADDNCLLFMWTTGPKINLAFPLIKEWGFEYSTIAFVWEKEDINPGYYTLSSTEFCLVSRKGNIPTPRGIRNVRQFYQEKKTKHSRKPSEIRNRITRMFPEQTKIELFARPPKDLLFEDESYKGWDLWGNEV